MASTVKRSNSNLLEGDKLYIKRARKAFPILVRQAKAHQPILYSDIAEELEMPNPRNMNYVLGAIGNAIIHLGDELGEKIPKIQALVINKDTGLPGTGISEFLDEGIEFKSMYKKEKEIYVKNILKDIYLYKKWDKVLLSIGLEPLKTNETDLIIRSKTAFKFGGGESESHLRFKKLIYENPTKLNLGVKAEPIQMEYSFPSADIIDIAFASKETFIGIEVKSKISDEKDILRGLFQCVKYDALINAEQQFKEKPKDSRVILALEGSLPNSLISIRNQLGIEVVDNLGIK